MNNQSNKSRSLSALFSKSFQLFISVSTFTIGICSNAIATTSFPIEKANLSNSTSIILASIRKTKFLENYPAGTTLCFKDRGVENKIQIVDFNQSFQVVDFVYLDGGYQGSKGSANYSDFTYNSYSCSY